MCENPGRIDMVAALSGKGQVRMTIRQSRIEDLLKAWEKHPGMRLGQFIVNALGLKEAGQLYEVHDEELLAKLHEYPQDPIKSPTIIP